MELKQKSILIVGDKFRAFAANDGVMCISDVEELVESRPSELEDSNYELGQGVSEARIRRLLEMASQVGCSSQFIFDSPRKCGIKHVHKKRPENSMISIPTMIAERQYQSLLLLDDSSELMIDHASGQHMQGMVLVEAARQMILAVTEEYYSEEIRSPLSFIWNSINTTFNEYAFPIKTNIDYRVKDYTQSSKKRFSMVVEIEFYQNDRSVCFAESTVDVYEKRVVKKHEHKLASQAVA